MNNQDTRTRTSPLADNNVVRDISTLLLSAVAVVALSGCGQAEQAAQSAMENTKQSVGQAVDEAKHGFGGVLAHGEEEDDDAENEHDDDDDENDDEHDDDDDDNEHDDEDRKD